MTVTLRGSASRDDPTERRIDADRVFDTGHAPYWSEDNIAIAALFDIEGTPFLVELSRAGWWRLFGSEYWWLEMEVSE